MSRLPS